MNSSKPEPPVGEDAIAWSLTTWEGVRREQLRRWRALPLDRIIRALEHMQVLVDAFGAKKDEKR